MRHDPIETCICKRQVLGVALDHIAVRPVNSRLRRVIAAATIVRSIAVVV